MSINFNPAKVLFVLAVCVAFAAILWLGDGHAETQSIAEGEIISGSDKTKDEAAANFARLEELYFRWESGLYGSRPSSRLELFVFCGQLVGREIKTGGDYSLLYPESPDGLNLHCRLYATGTSWLRLYGKPQLKSKVDFMQRSTELFSVRGTVTAFRVNDGAKTIDLWLSNITLAVVGNK